MTTTPYYLESKMFASSSKITTPALCLAVGILSFGGPWWALGFTLLFPAFLWKSDSRVVCFISAFLYHLGASRSLALSSVKFFEYDLVFGLLIWILGNTISSGVYTYLWHKDPWKRLMLIPIGILLTSIPPFGITGWANPLVSAGVLFPGTGVSGFIFVVGLYASLVAGTKPITTVFALISLWCLITLKIPDGTEVAGISTHFFKTEDGGKSDFRRLETMASLASKAPSKTKFLLFPESVLTGGWTTVSRAYWQRLAIPKVALLGVTDINMSEEQESYSNVLVMAGKNSDQRYVQRQPVPFSMWRPFISKNFQADWFHEPAVTTSGKRFGFLICYEGFLVWPVVHSYLAGAEHLAAPANFWWARDESLIGVHASMVKAWSRLFSLPYTLAVNR